MNPLLGRTFVCRFCAVFVAAFIGAQIPSSAEEKGMSVVAHASSGPIRCEIRKSGGGTSVRLTGIVSSMAPITGNARFLLAKSGPSGNSNINQGNDFTLGAGAETRVSSVTINLQHGDHAVVELQATSAGGIVCHAQALLEL